MDGLPKDTDFSPLVGRVVGMLRIGKFFAHLILDDDKRDTPSVWIEIESSDMLFTNNDAQDYKIDDLRSSGGLLCQLLGLTIERASRGDDGGLQLEFSTGFRLEVGIHTSRYESIVLHIGDNAIVG